MLIAIKAHQSIREAIDIIEKSTCIKFLPYDNKSLYFLDFQPGYANESVFFFTFYYKNK